VTLVPNTAATHPASSSAAAAAAGNSGTGGSSAGVDVRGSPAPAAAAAGEGGGAATASSCSCSHLLHINFTRVSHVLHTVSNLVHQLCTLQLPQVVFASTARERPRSHCCCAARVSAVLTK
jgi:hypothetical protein